jgi:hypothetical protein
MHGRKLINKREARHRKIAYFCREQDIANATR